MVVLTAAFFLNRNPNRSLQGQTPLHLLQLDSTLFFIISRVFRCTYFVQNCLPTHTNLDDKAVRCVFLGYSSMSKGYLCYDPISQFLYHSLDVTFLEDVPFFAGTPYSSGSNTETILANSDGLPHPIPLFEFPQVQVSPASDARAPLKVCTSHAPPLALCRTLLRYLVLLLSPLVPFLLVTLLIILVSLVVFIHVIFFAHFLYLFIHL